MNADEAVKASVLARSTHIEDLCRAWIFHTGLGPDQAELVETRDGAVTTWHVRLREPQTETATEPQTTNLYFHE